MRLNNYAISTKSLKVSAWVVSFMFAVFSPDLYARETEQFTGASGTATVAPDCMARGRKLDIDNAGVLTWKASSRDQFRSRARVSGTITKLYANRTGHIHLQATIGTKPTDTVEIIYNEHFGRVPRIPIGGSIEACGDYITARARTSRYPGSPDGALVHWVHRSTNTNHESGYMMVDGVVYGH